MIVVGDSSRPLLGAVRSGNLFSNHNAAALDVPERDYAFADGRSADSRFEPSRFAENGTESRQSSNEFNPAGRKRRAMVTEMPLRQDSAYPTGYDDADEYEPDVAPEFDGRARRSGLRLNFHGGLVPKTLWGRILSACALLLLAGAGIGAAFAARKFLLHDEHFLVPSADAIQIAGNSRLTRAQLLSVFGEDVDRNIFNIPLVQRRAQLESLPWVEHATVMRLLPNRIRVSIVERTPVAFVRQGSEIGLVDVNGVLLNLPGPDLSGTDLDEASTQQRNARDMAQYSFPVLTGISVADPQSTRAARMKIYLNFIATLDATGENISHQLSEVDVTSPEDVKAVIPDPAAGGADVLVHFGDGRFLERYRLYEQHLPEWRAQYPKLASADMRYERQVVLEMTQSSAATTPSDSSLASLTAPVPSAPAAAAPNPEPPKPVAVVSKPAVAAKAKPAHAAKPAVKAKAVVVAKKGPAAMLWTGKSASVAHASAHAEPVAHAVGATHAAHPAASMLATGKIASHSFAMQATQGAMR